MMDEKFRSSFIPKQPLVGQESGSPRYSRRREPSNPFMALSTFVFVVSGLIYAGVWGYTLLVEREIDEMEARLESQRQEFKPAEIAEYKRFDDRLKVAANVLNNHIALSEILALLSDITLPSVRYTSFDFSKDAVAATEQEIEGEIVRTEATERLTVVLEAEARTYEDIALQVKEFEANDFIRTSSFSDFILTDTGTIGFTIEATLDSRLIGYIAAINRAPEVSLEEAESGDFLGVEGEEVSIGDEGMRGLQDSLVGEEM
jgi:hypothetical protein